MRLVSKLKQNITYAGNFTFLKIYMNIILLKPVNLPKL